MQTRSSYHSPVPSSAHQAKSNVAQHKTTNKDAPEFAEEMSNVTVSLGRDVTFQCIVNNLGSYKVSPLSIGMELVHN